MKSDVLATQFKSQSQLSDEIYRARQLKMYGDAPEKVRAFIDKVRALHFDRLPFKAGSSAEIQESFLSDLATGVPDPPSIIAVNFWMRRPTDPDPRNDKIMMTGRRFQYDEICKAIPGFLEGIVHRMIADLAERFVLAIVIPDGKAP